MPLLLDEISQVRISRLNFSRTIAVLAVSPMERHGPHLPVGTDLILARHLAAELAARIESRWPDVTAVLCPPVPLGSSVVRGPGSIAAGQRALHDVIFDYARSLSRSGFRYLVFCNAHAGVGHLVALEEVSERARRELGMRADSLLSRVLIPFLTGAYASQIESRMGRRMSQEERYALPSDCHGGQWETGAILAIRPDLVDEGYRDLPPIPRPGWLQLAECMAESCRKELGYVGIPSLATPEYARAAADVLQDRVMSQVDRMLHGRWFRPSHTPFYYLPGYRTRPVYRSGHLASGIAVGLAAGLALGVLAGRAGRRVQNRENEEPVLSEGAD